MNAPFLSSNQKISSIALEKIFAGLQASPVEFVETVINESIGLGASDILFEPRKDTLLVRARIDGVLYELGTTSLASYAQIVSRVKILSQLDPTEKRRIQEGQATLSFQDRQVNLRVEIALTIYGELVVIRIHEKRSIVMSLSQLGFNQVAFQTYNHMLSQKSGLILSSGPTGSGKTTTLYSTLATLNEKQDQNVMTIEDPVEFQLEGVNQMQVDNTNGFTFANGLSTILRLSPDIVFVGEIRDRETAKTAVESGLTGQLVLSTAHAEDSIRTLFRLMDLEVETYFLNSALVGIVSQRLVRQLCPNCKTPQEPTQKDVDIFMNLLGRRPKQILNNIGCDQCNSIGFKGRIGIFEVLYMSAEVRDLLRSRANEAKLRDSLSRSGFVTLLKDGLEKVEAGLTTVDEVLRNGLRYS